MRVVRPLLLTGLLSLALLVPPASAEWGHYGHDGWPVNVDGVSTRPEGLAPIDWHVLGMTGMPPVNEVAGTTIYPYWPILTAEVQRLAADHPDLVRLHSIGKSTAGLDLWMLEIADFGNPDMRPLETREVVWVDGGTHSNEYSGVYFVTHLASFLLDEYAENETAKWIVENRHTWLMPMVNPDGSNLFGRLNANLVNINRNYPVIWDGSGHDAVMNNRGPAPASEIETQLNIEWFNKTQPDYYASVHCCGNLWLYPYGEEGVDPVDNDTLSRVCDEAFPTVRSDCGPIWSTIYPASGSSVDTAYEYTGAVAFGYEMSGRGAAALWGQPLTTESVREQEIESWEGVMHAFLNVHRYGGYPVDAGMGISGDGFTKMIRNDGYGPIPAGTVRATNVENGASESVALPELAPGETAAVVLPVGDVLGTWRWDIEYQKRYEAAPTGQAEPLFSAVERAGNSGYQIRTAGSLEALDAGDGAATSVPVTEATPGPSLALIATALVLAFVQAARRRDPRD